MARDAQNLIERLCVGTQPPPPQTTAAFVPPTGPEVLADPAAQALHAGQTAQVRFEDQIVLFMIRVPNITFQYFRFPLDMIPTIQLCRQN